MRPQNSLFHLATVTLLCTIIPTPYTLHPTLVSLAQTMQDQKAEADRLLQQGIQQFQTSQFEAAMQSWQQALQIYRELKDRQSEGAALGNLGLAYYSLNNYEKAIDYEQQLLLIAREINDRQSEEAALGNLGLAYYSLRDYEKAIGYGQQVLAISRESHDRQSEGKALGNLGLAYGSLGSYEKAIEYEQQWLAITRETHNRQDEGKALGNLGNIYGSLYNYEKAVKYHQQALTIDQEIYDRQGEGQDLDSLGTTYQSSGNYEKAIEYHEQSLEIARAIKVPQREEGALGNLGDAYRSLGNYGKAIEYYQQALLIARAIKDREVQGETIGSLGITYLMLGNLEKAVKYEQLYLKIARAIKVRRSELKALNNLGIAYQALGNYGKANEYHQQALLVARTIKDRQDEGATLGNLGTIDLDLGNYEKAIEYEQQWLAIARKIKDRRSEGAALSNLGVAYRHLGDYEKAIKYEQQCLVIAREIKDRQGEGQALNNLGLALFNSGNLPEAARTLMDGIATWELLRHTGAGTDANKVSIFEGQARTYRTLQQVRAAQNQPNAALEIAERGRARAFVELLTQRGSQGSGVRSQEGVKPPTVSQLQQIAKAQNATLVQYSIIYEEFKIQNKQELHESDLYIWVIQPTGEITFRKADLKPLWHQQKTTLAELVDNSRKGIGVLDRGDRASLKVSLTPEYLQQLHAQQSRYLKQLHQLLIEPIADLLPTYPTAHVIFMPQESLFLVPFAALQDKTDQYLIQQHTISIAPAIQVLGLTHQQQKAVRSQESGARSVLVAGNPIMPQVTVPGADAPLYLPELPGAEQEAIAVAKSFNTTALTGKQATKHAIVQQMQTARIIHLATHGLLDDFKGLGVPGAIALAPDGNGQPNDGLLTSDDILGMKLKAELVVLSACNTGRGKLTGDGVIGLSRSLIAAGVPSIMVSLWSVPDAPTAALMTDFYTTLQHTPDKAQALRQAMLDTMKTHPEPRDWAAFTLIGEAQ
jgi:CHAT domain-containing protein/Flp pilus assembly protein TadD